MLQLNFPIVSFESNAFNQKVGNDSCCFAVVFLCSNYFHSSNKYKAFSLNEQQCVFNISFALNSYLVYCSNRDDMKDFNTQNPLLTATAVHYNSNNE